jgi:hypothetical protein
MEISMEVPQKPKLDLPYDPAMPFPEIYWKECKSAYNGDTCTSIFTVALFTIARL